MNTLNVLLVSVIYSCLHFGMEGCKLLHSAQYTMLTIALRLIHISGPECHFGQGWRDEAEFP